MTRPLSLAALTVLELTPPEMVTCAAEAGFSHVGIRLLSTHCVGQPLARTVSLTVDRVCQAASFALASRFRLIPCSAACMARAR